MDETFEIELLKFNKSTHAFLMNFATIGYSSARPRCRILRFNEVFKINRVAQIKWEHFIIYELFNIIKIINIIVLSCTVVCQD